MEITVLIKLSLTLRRTDIFDLEIWYQFICEQYPSTFLSVPQGLRLNEHQINWTLLNFETFLLNLKYKTESCLIKHDPRRILQMCGHGRPMTVAMNLVVFCKICFARTHENASGIEGN